MKKTVFLTMIAAFMLLGSKVNAQSYFAVELTTSGQFAYVKTTQKATTLVGKSLKGKATTITETQFKAIIAGETVKAIKINGVPHVPTPVALDGGYKWCSYETPSGATAYYQCKIPKDGSDCCTMVIDLTPTTPEK